MRTKMVDDARLIEEVSRYDFLYNFALCKNGATSKDHRVPAWQNIAKNMGISVDECKQRWRLLRDTYVRYHKKARSNGGPVYWKLYDNMSFLEPYIMKRKRRSSSYTRNRSQEEEDTEDGELESLQDLDADTESQGQQEQYAALSSDSFDSKQPDFVIESVTGREDPIHDPTYEKILTCLQHVMPPIVQAPQPIAAATLPPERDETELYLLSLAPALRRMTPRNRARARIKIEMIMEEMEFGELGSTSSNTVKDEGNT